MFVAASFLIPWLNKVYFLWDDIEFLMRLKAPALGEFLLSHQYQFQPLFYAVYWLEIQLFGVHPQPFFFISILVHLLNIYLVHSIIYRLTKSKSAALTAAGLVSFNKSYYSVVFWQSIFSNQLLVLLLLIAVLAYLNLEKTYSLSSAIVLGIALLSAGFTQGFGVGAGLVFALTVLLFWRNKPWWKNVFWVCAIVGLISIFATVVFSIPEIQTDRKFEFSFQRLLNLAYFTAVGPSQAIINRFFLPGFIPNIHSQANIAVMILIPAILLIFLLWIIIKNINNKRRLSYLLLFNAYTVIPYFIAGLARSGPGALGGIAERYVYPPFFFFILTLVYASFLCQNTLPIKLSKHSLAIKVILIGAIIILSLGQQAVMHLEVYNVFL